MLKPFVARRIHRDGELVKSIPVRRCGGRYFGELLRVGVTHVGRATGPFEERDVDVRHGVGRHGKGSHPR